MAFLHEEENDHNHKDEKKEHGAEGRYSSEPQKAHPTGEFMTWCPTDLKHLCCKSLINE